MPDPIVYVVQFREIDVAGDVKCLAMLKGMAGVKPYDVILHEGEVKHFVNGRLRKHKEIHGHHPKPAALGTAVVTIDPEEEEDRLASLITLRSGENGDQIVWVAPRPFAVVQIVASEDDDHQTPRNPFPWSPPAPSGPTLRVASGPPLRHDKRRQYKAIFAMENQLIDPDFVCTPP